MSNNDNDFSQLAAVGLPTLSLLTGTSTGITAGIMNSSNNPGGGTMSGIGVNGNGNPSLSPSPSLSWNRSLKELKVASDALLFNNGGRRQQVSNASTTNAIVNPSTSMGINSSVTMSRSNRLSELERLTDSLETKMSDSMDHVAATTTTNDGIFSSSVEETIRNHEIHILDRILRREEEETRERSQQMLETQLQNDWEKTAQTYCKELVGTRTLGGLHSQQQHQHQQHYNHPGGITSTGLGFSNTNTNTNTSTNTNTNHNHQFTSPQIIQENLQVISNFNRSIHANDGQINTTILMETISNLQKIADPLLSTNNNDANKSTTTTPQQSCYGTAWQLISSMIERNSFGNSISSANQKNASPIQNGMAAIILLCAQFQTLIMNRVRKANLASGPSGGGGGGQPLSFQQQQQQHQYSSSLANTISKFVKLEIGSTTASLSLSTSSSYPWPELYYCLRSGDAIAAKEILDAAATNNISDVDYGPIIQIVSHLAKHQGSNVCYWLSGIPILSRQDRQNIADIYERFKNMIMEEKSNTTTTMNSIQSNTNNMNNNDNYIHKIGTLSLLCGLYELPTSGRIAGFSTIEDYLFGALSKSMNSGNGNSGSEEQIIQELIHVGTRIQHFGPNHFEDHESGGWSYALPLLFTQQYHTALVYLADNGGPMGLVQATHIGLILSLLFLRSSSSGSDDGYTIQDLKQVPSNQTSSSTALTMRDADQQPSISSTSARSECLLTELIVAYATLLQAQFPAFSTISGGSTVVPALEYLVRIPNRARIRKGVATLIMRSNDCTKLTGILSQDGKRSKNSGALDIHFTELEISSILVESAETLYKDINDNKKCQIAAMLFMLAGHYRSVLLLLNNLISPIDKASLEENKRFWFQQTTMFHQNYLEKRTHVLEVLEKEGNLNLVTTSRILMGLYYFFDYYYQGALDQAMSVINNDYHHQQQQMQQNSNNNLYRGQSLDLLPTSKSDLSSKESRFHGLDQLVQQCFPMILKCSMEILNHQHRRVKSELHLASGGGGGIMFGAGAGAGMSSISNNAAAHQRLIEIKEQAGLLIAFAGLLPNVAGENIDSMTRMEALMI